MLVIWSKVVHSSQGFREGKGWSSEIQRNELKIQKQGNTLGSHFIAIKMRGSSFLTAVLIWVEISLKLLNVYVLVTQSCLTLCNPTDCSLPGFSVHGFSSQEYWSGLPFPSPEELSNPRIEPWSPALQAGS